MGEISSYESYHTLSRIFSISLSHAELKDVTNVLGLVVEKLANKVVDELKDEVYEKIDKELLVEEVSERVKQGIAEILISKIVEKECDIPSG